MPNMVQPGPDPTVSETPVHTGCVGRKLHYKHDKHLYVQFKI